jgi:hypothetical protein
MNELIIIKDAAKKLGEYFDDEIFPAAESYETLHEKLTEHITFLLLHDMEKLLQLFYRIDVAEKDVKRVFAQHDPRQIAPQLAGLVIRRELKKAETRLTYRKP